LPAPETYLSEFNGLLLFELYIALGACQANSGGAYTKSRGYLKSALRNQECPEAQHLMLADISVVNLRRFRCAHCRHAFQPPSITKERQYGIIALLLESRFDRHSDSDSFRFADELGHHSRPLLQRHDRNYMRYIRRESGTGGTSQRV
jgi:hypothetical protein